MDRALGETTSPPQDANTNWGNDDGIARDNRHNVLCYRHFTQLSRGREGIDAVAVSVGVDRGIRLQ